MPSFDLGVLALNSPDAASPRTGPAASRRAYIEQLVAGLDPLLPGQAPLLDFVHHNTLHGFQHLPFEEALAEVERITGIAGHLCESEFRRYYAEQRIENEDLDAVLSQARDLEPDTVLLEIGGATVRRRDLYRLAMLHGIEQSTPEALRWASQEDGVFERIMDDIPPGARHRLLQGIKMQSGLPSGRVPAPGTFVRALWAACAAKLGLPSPDADPAVTFEATIDDTGAAAPEDAMPAIHDECFAEEVEHSLARVGDDRSVPALLGELTGRSGIEALRPVLVRICAAVLDEGVAAWHAPDREAGLYAVWRQSVSWNMRFPGIHALALAPGELPPEASAAVAGELARIGLPEDRWRGYLARIALELPGWAGLVNWRAHHAGYPANRTVPASLTDWLAIRLVLDRLWSDAVCRETWGIAATLPALHRHFAAHACEFSMRRALYRGSLPEDLATIAHRLVAVERPDRTARRDWQAIAHRYRAHLGTRAALGHGVGHTAHGSVWRLFRLAQHLGLTAAEVDGLPSSQAERLLRILDDFTPRRRAQLWLLAYERHYRQRLFQALADNHAQDSPRADKSVPEAQLICCMDDREESLRRHLEELNPRIETLGAAGFFGVPMYWRGLDDTRATPLCPIVVTPSNEVRERPRPGEAERLRSHRRWHRLGLLRDTVLQHELRRHPLSSAALVELTAPGYLIGLAAKLLRPGSLARRARIGWLRLFPPVRTVAAVEAEATASHSDHPRLGFTDAEQADRVAAFLRTIGLVDRLAPLVVLLGHGSTSENNPHRAAYDCGACSGRHGGPNARAFAAMANRSEVRRILAERGLRIPDATWFVGAEHDTCSDAVTWFDLVDLPPVLRPAHHNLNRQLSLACQRSAQERCRRFASAPSDPSSERALAHVRRRSHDFSQVRPELGHATHAAALVGRRGMSQGIFLDRRVFLISYDPTTDADGAVLEAILLAVGPVGAGINLEYYFSTVAPDRFGCGTKVPHNVTGFFGVMDGASSDLRTGLPRQMTEIHEPMRLLLVVEQTPEVVMAICQRQAPLRELFVNGWVVLACKDPRDGSLSLFENGTAFVRWERPASQTPRVAMSADWYAGHSGPRPPALIRSAPDAPSQAGHA